MGGLSFRNLPPSRRIGEILDLATVSFLGARQVQDFEQEGSARVQEACRELFTDVSQNPARKAWTGRRGVSRCLTTSSLIYAHGADRILLPVEHMFFQGHHVDLKMSASMRQNSLRDLAGEGMNLACLASLISALRWAGSFNV